MTHRYSCQPAAELLRRLATQQRMSMAELASRYGLPFSLVRQCLEGGYLREASADRLACGLGRHPAELWPDWFPAPLLAR